MISVQLVLIASLSSAMRRPVSSKPNPSIFYTVTIDTADLSGFDVTMQIQGAPETIRLAMAVHPEYNDRFWRYVRNLRADELGKPVSIAIERE